METLYRSKNIVASKHVFDDGEDSSDRSDYMETGLKVLSTKISGLLMFFEIGKLCARKNFFSFGLGVCCKR